MNPHRDDDLPTLGRDLPDFEYRMARIDERQKRGSIFIALLALAIIILMKM